MFIFSWVSYLIDLILYVFWCVSSFCAFLSFWALILVVFLLLHREAVFTSPRFFLNCSCLPRNSMFFSYFGWYAFCHCFHVGIDEVLIFVIRYKCFGYLLKCRKWRYRIFIANTSIPASYFCTDHSAIGRHTFKRGICLTIQSAINPFLIYEDIVYLCFRIIYISAGS